MKSVAVWLWLATKGHTVTLPPLPLLGMGRRVERKRQNSWVRIRAV